MVDRYTKFVLTVIAGCLLALVVQQAIGQSRAQNIGLQKVQICDDVGCASLSPWYMKMGGKDVEFFALDVNSKPR